MTAKALLSALGLWTRQPKAMLLLNLAWAAVAYAGIGAGAKILGTSTPNALTQITAIALLLIVWLAFCWMLRAIAQMDRGQRFDAAAARLWLRDAWAPRFVFGLAWIEASLVLGGLLLRSDRAGLPRAFFGLGVAAWAWWTLGALLSAGLDAPLEQPPWAAQKSGLLAAVAFLPTSLALAAVTVYMGGPVAILAERSQWWSRIFWIPLIAAPVFTPSFYAAYVYYLAQGIKDKAQGRQPLEGAPTIKEIMRPWR